ncbi:MAG TPA: histidine phosphatase family protein [Geminocystis sp. M7585_C2015_104]|nr:histidine phosphatase family protein [Geminocystis sp. M7585_C2015_104]
MSLTLYLARHGERLDFVEPEWFTRALRKYDPPLSEKGKIQAEKLGKRLKKEGIERILASPFLRTIQTAHIIAEILGLKVCLEAGLGEWLNPNWMTSPPLLHPREELEGVYPRIDWRYVSQIFPVYPETEEEVLTRMRKMTELLVTQFSGHILVVGHGITVAGIVESLVGKVDISPSFCSLTKIVWDDRGKAFLELNAEDWFLYV